MGNMRDQLLKAGLADKKRERKVRHQEEARKKELGQAGVEAEEQAREQEARAERERQRAENRRREEEKQQRHETELHSERVPALIRGGLVRANAFGNRRFHFVTRDQKVSYIEVAPGVQRGLSEGRHAIVETRGVTRDDYCVVDADTARSIRMLEPDRIVAWFGNGGVGAPQG